MVVGYQVRPLADDDAQTPAATDSLPPTFLSAFERMALSYENEAKERVAALRPPASPLDYVMNPLLARKTTRVTGRGGGAAPNPCARSTPASTTCV